ncbi:hypothetical protein HII31_09464 [Pseudocercospora fuligena]|uniref:Uncharacterized protein n=1 Tax=Pseudocercospora fuligena TaxID=685502 RepID=A0A8H6VFY2_9PEZI|nr:hypothetical protein HII31_09464 [Pseudocercospora fuligena]
MAVTYNIAVSSKATRTFHDLPKKFLISHRQFDPTLPSSSIKILHHMLHNAKGYFLTVGGVNGGDEMSYGYIRVVIDVMKGTLDGPRKAELLKRTMDVCLDYEGKKAGETEVEVRINEIEEENVLRVIQGQ